MAKERRMVAHRSSGSRGFPSRTPGRERRVPPPLDEAALNRLSLRYVERYATTRGKLVDYLRRKLRERGWDGERPADAEALADRHVAAGHVDDTLYARVKAESLARRGYGERRIAAALSSQRVGADDRQAALDQLPEDGTTAALRLLRRRRLGPFARVAGDDDAERRTLGVLLRAGHDFAEARRALALTEAQATAAIEEASARDDAAPWG